MTSTYSTSLRLELIGTGDQQGTWGVTTNTNLGTLLEQAIGGYEAITISDANYTLTTANGASDQARNMVLKISGTLTANRNVSCPNGIEKLYLVENATTGGYSIVFKTVSGTGVTIPNGAKALVYVDGTNAVSSTFPTTAATNTFGASQIVDVLDNTNAALRVTQRGTGDALLVEDITNPDSSPFVIDNGGRVVAGHTAALTASSSITPINQVVGWSSTGVSGGTFGAFAFSANTTGPYVHFNKSRGATPGTNTIVSAGDALGTIRFSANDGTGFVDSALISSIVEGTPSTGNVTARIAFYTADATSGAITERMRLTNIGRLGIGTTNPAGGIEVIDGLTLFRSSNTANANSITRIHGGGYTGNPATLIIGSGSSGSNIVGIGGGTSTGEPATTISFYTGSAGTLDAGTERMRITSSGSVGIGSTPSAGHTLEIARNITGSTTARSVYTPTTVMSDVTSSASGFRTQIATEAASFTLTNLFHYYAGQGTIGATSNVTTQAGFIVENTLTGAATNYGFLGTLSSATGRWNYYASGTAPNYFAGDVRTNNNFTYNVSPGNSNASTTLTVSQLKNTIFTTTPTSNVTFTLPTGTLTDAGFQDLQTNHTFNWSVINLASATFTATVAAGTDHTVVGNMVVSPNTSGRFATRKTAANTFVTYRVG